MIARKPGSLLSPTVWGEDGTIFWGQWLTDGLNLFTPYAAQWWVSQRLLIAGLSWVPTPAMPLIIYLTSAVVATLAVAVVLQKRAEPVFGQYQWLAFAGLILLPTVTEIQGNLANLQVWLAMGLLVLLVVQAPRTHWGKAAELAYIVAAGLTGFLGVILAPVALWAAVRNSDRYVRARSGLMLLLAMVNVVVWASQDRPPGSDLGERLLTLPGAVAKRWGGGLILGHHGMRFVWPDGFLSLWLIPSLAMLALLGYLAWVDRRGMSWVWLVSAAIWLALGVIAPATTSGPEWVAQAAGGWRYFGLAIAVGVLVLVRGLLTAPRIATIGLVACTVAFLLGAPLRSPTAKIDPAQMQTFSACLDGDQRPCTLGIAPEGWTITLN